VGDVGVFQSERNMDDVCVQSDRIFQSDRNDVGVSNQTATWVSSFFQSDRNVGVFFQAKPSKG
jgi:hypothetical protein